MTRNDIIVALNTLGYEVKVHDVVKNGVKLEGIIFKNEKVSPVIYINNFISKSEKRTAEEVAMDIIKLYRETKKYPLDVKKTIEKPFVLSNIRIGLQKAGSEPLVKRVCENLKGLEMYLFVMGKDKYRNYSFKIFPSFLKFIHVSEDEAWMYAEKNTFSNIKLLPIEQMIGGSVDESKEGEQESALYTLTNKENFKGASSILNKEVLRGFAQKFGVEKIIAVPSSIHEFLLFPYMSDCDIEMINKTIKAINASEVLAEEQLADRVFVLEI